MSGKRVLWRDRCDERVRERRRRQGRILAAMAQAAADAQPVAADEAWVDEAATSEFDLSAWLALEPPGEATPMPEAPPVGASPSAPPGAPPGAP